MSSKEITTISTQAEKEPDFLKEFFEELGLNIEDIRPDIIRKLRLLDQRTEIFKDEKRAIHIARALFKFYEEKFPEKRFTDDEQKTVLIGTIFTDIGKAGPRDATPEQEEVVLDIYNVENITDPEKITLANFVNENFPKNSEKMLRILDTISRVSRNMTMREFYNLHSWWTLEIVSGDGVPPEAIAAAAAHHVIEGVNPKEIIGKDGRFTKYFGNNVSFSRDDKLVIILDKYDAFRRRGKKEHKEAINLVRQKIQSNPNFAKDTEFEELINSLDAMISTDEEIYKM